MWRHRCGDIDVENENSDNGHIRVRGQSVRAKGKELQQLTAELNSMIKEQR